MLDKKINPILNDPEDFGKCSICGGELEPIYENVGFTPPDPTHYEITGYKPCTCTDEDDHGEDQDD